MHNPKLSDKWDFFWAVLCTFVGGAIGALFAYSI